MKDLELEEVVLEEALGEAELREGVRQGLVEDLGLHFDRCGDLGDREEGDVVMSESRVAVQEGPFDAGDGRVRASLILIPRRTCWTRRSLRQWALPESGASERDLDHAPAGCGGGRQGGDAGPAADVDAGA